MDILFHGEKKSTTLKSNTLCHIINRDCFARQVAAPI